MAIPINAIRTAVSEVMEGSLGTVHPADGVFEFGAFDGQPDDAKLARLRQESTATHWFDVVVGQHENHAAAAISSKTGHRRIARLPIVVEVWTGLRTEVQESERGLVLAAIASDCDDARQALGYLGAITQTAGAVATDVVGGVVRGPDFTGLPDYERVEENWDKRWIHSRIIGAVAVTEAA